MDTGQALPQRRMRGDHEVTWQLDLAVASRLMRWSRRVPELLAREAREMIEHFPHWLLTSGSENRPHGCPRCGEMMIFAEGKSQCIACGGPPDSAATQLIWVGHLPTLWRNEDRLQRYINPLKAAGCPLISVNNARYLLVPIHVGYPTEWPNQEPSVCYSSGFLSALGIGEHASSTSHMLGGGMACLYAHGQWNGVSVRSVLQQRLVNHLASLIKIAAGIDPNEAFIGRIH